MKFTLMLTTRLEDATIRAPALDAPITLRVAGSYNAVAATLEGDLGTTARLRESGTPFPAVLRIAAGETRLDFEGTMTEPLDVDGADGRLRLRAPSPDTLLAVAGSEAEIDAAFEL